MASKWAEPTPSRDWPFSCKRRFCAVCESITFSCE